jgi:hypothetical protein
MTKRTFAFETSFEKLAASSKRMYFWTFTTPDEVSLEVLSKRWAAFRQQFARTTSICGLRVFERHQGGHGWHVHFVIPQYVDVGLMRPMAEKYGFGRINAKRVRSSKKSTLQHYLGKYLTKDYKGVRDENIKGARLWAAWGYDHCKIRDVICDNPLRPILAKLDDDSVRKICGSSFHGTGSDAQKLGRARFRVAMMVYHGRCSLITVGQFGGSTWIL